MLTLSDLPTDCLLHSANDQEKDLFRNLTACNLLMLKFANRFFNNLIPSRREGYDSSKLLVSACQEGSLPVLDYLYSVLGAKFPVSMLKESNPDIVGLFAWISQHLSLSASPVEHQTMVELVNAYNSLAVRSRSYEAMMSAYKVVKSGLSLPNHKIHIYLTGGLSLPACLCLYDRFGSLDIRDKVMPSLAADNILMIAKCGPRIVGIHCLPNVFDLMYNKRDDTPNFKSLLISVLEGALIMGNKGGFRFVDLLMANKAVLPELMAVVVLCMTPGVGPIGKKHRKLALEYVKTKTEITDQIILEAIHISGRPHEHLINEAIRRGLSLPANIFEMGGWSKSEPDLCLLIVQHGGAPDTSKRVMRRIRRDYPLRVAELTRTGFR